MAVQLLRIRHFLRQVRRKHSMPLIRWKVFVLKRAAVLTGKGERAWILVTTSRTTDLQRAATAPGKVSHPSRKSRRRNLLLKNSLV